MSHVDSGTDTQSTVLFYFIGSSNTEDSDFTSKLIRRYGIPKSQTPSPSSAMSPIVLEQYRLFEPVTGDLNTTVKQAQGLGEEDEDGVTWCTR